MIFEIIRAVFGLLFALFVPGFLVVAIFFKEEKPMEKLAFSITFSIMISIIIAIFFGYNAAVKDLFGGITFENLVLGEVVVNCSLLILLGLDIFFGKKEKKKVVKHKEDEAIERF